MGEGEGKGVGLTAVLDGFPDTQTTDDTRDKFRWEIPDPLMPSSTIPRFKLEALVVSDSELPERRGEERIEKDSNGAGLRGTGSDHDIEKQIARILIQCGYNPEKFRGKVAVAYADGPRNIVGTYIVYENTFRDVQSSSDQAFHASNPNVGPTGNRIGVAILESVHAYLNPGQRRDTRCPVIITRTHFDRLKDYLTKEGAASLIIEQLRRYN